MKPFALALTLALAAAAVSAAPPVEYHLELEAAPAAAFPYLARFGTVDLHVYRTGVRGEVLWLSAFSRSGTSDVTIMNPLARMYVEVPIAGLSSIVAGLAGGEEYVEKRIGPEALKSTDGKVQGIAAKRHRLVFGPDAFIDYWTTTTLPDNAHLRRLVNELLRGISPQTAKAAEKISGVPLYVELNFRRFKKVRLVRMKKLSLSAGDQNAALQRGAFYVRASVLEKLWEK